MKSVKTIIKPYIRKNIYLHKLWLYLQWAKAKWNMRYSDYEFAKKIFCQHEGKKWNDINPITYNEKLWFLKLSNRNPLLTKCSDKHAVREYISDCGLSEILKTEYACFNNADEIDFSQIPFPCYLKCTHGSGLNIVFNNNTKTNIKHIRWVLNFLLKQNTYILSREWNYKYIVPKIVCEEVLINDNSSIDIPELQFFCFDGVPKFIMYNIGLADKDGYHKKALRWVFDMEFQILKVKTSMATSNEIPAKPKNLDKMIEYARILSKPFPHVRVDLYNINGKIYFGELTFYSGGGFVKIEPIEWQKNIGDWLDISKYSIAPDAYEKDLFRWKSNKLS